MNPDSLTTRRLRPANLLSFPVLLTSLFSLLLFTGCDTGTTGSQTGSKENKEGDKKKNETKSNADSSKKKSTKIVKKSFSSSNKNAAFATSRLGGSRQQVSLGKAVWDYAIESQKSNPTVVIWLFDISKSADKLREKIISELKTYKSEEAKFESVVGTFQTGPVTWKNENPTSDFNQIREQINEIKSSGKEGENTFAAVAESSEKFGGLRRSQRKSVFIVLITDEEGDDGEANADKALASLKKHGIPLFVIGSPAPFGRDIDAAQSTRSDLDYGPETAFPERVKLGMWDGATNIHRFDSGYGPWQLERLSRGSGGSFLANRPTSRSMRLVSRMQSNWPDVISKVFDEQTMSQYRPFYGTLDEYRAQLSANKAKMALHQASKLSFTDVFRVQNYEFAVQNEAQLVRSINSAQRTPAVVRQGLEKLYNILREGEKDRDKLDSKRWKASYDLAYGRVMANFVRVIGLNAMLAEMKGGKKFQNPNSNRWLLEPSDEVSTGSGDKKMADKAKMYLTRVVEEHPNTPWAEIASRELESSFGWKWTEVQR